MITTKYIGPTNHNAGRIQARDRDGWMYVEWDHSLDTIANHQAAAKALCARRTAEHKDDPHYGALTIIDVVSLPDHTGWYYGFVTHWAGLDNAV